MKWDQIIKNNLYQMLVADKEQANFKPPVVSLYNFNKKQCSRQLQCQVPCGVRDVVNSSLFTNSSLSSLSSTSHAIFGGGGVQLQGGSGGARGLGEGGGGQGTFPSSCHILHYHKVLRPKGTSHKKVLRHPLGTSGKKQNTCKSTISLNHKIYL